MKFPNLLGLNDWHIRKFTLFIIFIMIMYDIISIFISLLKIKVPFEIGTMITLQLLGFFVLTFIPGFIILRILKVNHIDYVLNILLVIGLSISFNTLLGFFINEIISIVDPRPISFIPLFMSYNVALIVLLIVCNYRDVETNIKKEYMEIDISKVAVLFIVPSLAVAGVYLINYFDTNYLNILLFIIISLMPFLYRYTNFHTTIIWASAISILFSTQLISSYLWSWDIHFQYYFANLVVDKGFWDHNIYRDINSLLSIILLAPIYSFLLNLDLVWIYKIVYPFFFSFVPLGIYYITKNQFNDSRTAFFASFVFMFYYGFFKDMIDKQFIAELFLVLVIIVILDDMIKEKKGLILVFLIMLPLSHYGVSYIFLIALIFTIFIMRLYNINELSIEIVEFFVVFVFSWHIFTSGGDTFNVIVNTGHHAIMSLEDIFSRPEMRSGMSYLNLPSPSLVWEIYKAVNIILLLFISIGIIKLIVSFLKRRIICKNYIFGLTAIMFSGFLLYQIFGTLSLAMDRSLQVTLTILSPFAFFGFTYISGFIKKLRMLELFPLFLFIFFIFSSGLVHEATNNPLSYTVALNKNKEWHVYSLAEIESVKWIKNRDIDYVTVINPYRTVVSRDGTLVSGFYAPEKIIGTTINTSELKNSYIYIGAKMDNDIQTYPFYSTLIPKSNKIYDSDDSKIYLTQQ